jgi:hypothetical protein
LYSAYFQWFTRTDLALLFNSNYVVIYLLLWYTRSEVREISNMAVLTPPRPDLLAYREATTLEFPKLVTELTGILGKKLTAYIASVKDARAVERWMAGSESYKGVEERLRLAYRLAKMISDHEGPRVVQAWFTGLNPELNDRVPVRLLREENVEDVGPEILGAARAFLAGG